MNMPRGCVDCSAQLLASVTVGYKTPAAMSSLRLLLQSGTTLSDQNCHSTLPGVLHSLHSFSAVLLRNCYSHTSSQPLCCAQLRAARPWIKLDLFVSSDHRLLRQHPIQTVTYAV